MRWKPRHGVKMPDPTHTHPTSTHPIGLPTMANATQKINLRLDLYEVDCHAQTYMKGLGITYDHATPQSIGDCWWFWNCRNVPSPMPPALSALKCTPHEAIGYGLSKEDADRIDQGANA